MITTTVLVGNHNLDIFKLHTLRNCILITLTSMLERREDRAIHLQMQSTLQAKSVRQLLIECFEYLKIADDDTDDMVKEEAANIYSLTGLLAIHCPTYLPNLDPERVPEDERETYASALKAIKENMGHVEIFWNGKLERIFFAIPEMCAGLTNTRRKEVVWGVDRSSAEGKLSDFVEWSDIIYIYLKHEEDLRQFFLYRYVSQMSPFLLNFRMILSLAINALILLTFTAPKGTLLDAEPLYEFGEIKNEVLENIILAMGSLNILCAFLVILCLF